MISIVLEQYGVARPGQIASPLPRRPLPSMYFTKSVKPHNPDDLSDDAPAAKQIHRQHVAKSRKHTSIGYDPDPGQQLTASAARA